MILGKMIDQAGAFFWTLCAALAIVSFLTVFAHAQSTEQNFPTAVTGNELSGRIKARDLGDARLTTYYYTFNARQGDLFVNLVTKNLNGSVDVFAADGLRPLGQIMVYADLSSSETGRVIYLRKPEKILLRIEGRTPNDEAAEFQLKFAGSFEAVAPTEELPPPKVSDTALETDSGVKVNSVGTIVAVIPKPRPTPTAVTEPAETAETKPSAEKPAKEENTDQPSETVNKPAEEAKTTEPQKKPIDETKVADEKKPAVASSERPTRRTRPLPSAKKVNAETATSERKAEATVPATEESKKEETETAPTEQKRIATVLRRNPRVVVTDKTAEPKPDPLASITLVILFKDGTKIERPMNEVTRFSVDRGTLTVIYRDGTTAKYSILEVTSVTIQ
jgi:hypothetical protein